LVLGREFTLVWERMSRESPHSEPMSPTSPLARRRDPFFPLRHHQDGRAADLSNRKLAHNQTELSKQILELRSIVEAQGKLIARLVAVLDGKGKARAREID
ncbi:hypothetical protein GGX14DRAFT_355754, partial [Mycena pura]